MAEILDCTLRDGGYYTNWMFDAAFVSSFWSFHAESSIGIELGYISPVGKFQSSFYGPFRNCSSSFIRSFGEFNIADKDVAVMVNMKELRDIDSSQKDQFLWRLIHDNTPWNMVRIAVDIELWEDALRLGEYLSAHGLRWTINLMKCTSIDELTLQTLVNRLTRINGSVPVVYFADSLGSVCTSWFERFEALFTSFVEDGIELGFHGHNNRNMALANTLKALELGFTYLDASVLGIGRGAGNCQLEHLMLEMASCTTSELERLLCLVENHVMPLRNKYQWGPSMLFDMASRAEQHPNLVLDINSSSSDLKPNLKLSLIAGHSFVEANTEECQSNEGIDSLRNDIQSRFDSEYVLLFLGGVSLLKHASAIQHLKELRSLPAMSVNFRVRHIKQLCCDYFVTASQLRLMSYLNSEVYDKNLPIISSSLVSPAANQNLIHMPIELETGLSLEYALEVIYRLGFSRVYLAGLDQKEASHGGSSEYMKTSSVLDLYSARLSLSALHPTQHAIPLESVYDLII